MEDKEFLETLVNELTSDRPNRALVRELMLKCQIPYTNDPIQQMTAVLNSLDRFSKTLTKADKGRKQEKEREL